MSQEILLSLQMDPSRASTYKSPTQQTKRVTEHWVNTRLYCLRCGKQNLAHIDEPVLDFVCANCREQYELKSSRSMFRGTVVDSAYSVIIEKIKGGSNPSFLFLQYEYPAWRVHNLFALPRHVFYPDAIRRRNPLSEKAQRKGHVLSEILLRHLPFEARVDVVKHGMVVPKREVVGKWAALSKFGEVPLELRGWTLHVWSLVTSLGKSEFTLSDAYGFEETLKSWHRDNRHVKEKIRQQLQRLRDIGLLEFQGKGNYRLKKATSQLQL